MNIAILSAANSIHTEKIVNSLIEFGHNVFLFSLPNHEDKDGNYNPKAVIKYFKTSGTKGYFFNVSELKAWIQKYKIDVLNAHYATGYGSLGGLCGFHPYVLSVWGADVYDFPYISPFHKLLLKHNLKKADILMSTSNCMAKQTEKFIKNKQIVVTPFGVNIDEFSVCNKAPSDTVNIGFIKGVSEKYGIEYLVRAFKIVKDTCNDKKVKLLVYGDGNQLEEMINLSKELGISDDTKFFGHITHDKVADALKQIDIFCVPSTLDSESFGVSAIEAMSCGIPCITSDVEGLSEVMINNKTGFIIKRKNSEELANNIIKLINNPELRKKLGEGGRERVVKMYNWKDNVKIIESTLRKSAE